MLALDRVRVKGRLLPVQIFTCLGDRAFAASPAFQALRDAQERLLALYRGQDWDGAEAALADCRRQAPATLHGFYDLYAARIAAYRADSPSADWDGVYEAKSKAG